MIGNDIVDLIQAAQDSNWKRPRFLDKVFTVEEQQLIGNAKNQHQLVWLLWSMKEAAYKVHVQQFGKRFFNPKRLVCELASETSGIVKIDEEIYFTTSTITNDYIYTVATLEASKVFKSKCFEVENSNYHFESKGLKMKFLEIVSKLKKTSIEELQIRKNAVGVPRLFQNNLAIDNGFSFTHHGRFSAWSML